MSSARERVFCSTLSPLFNPFVLLPASLFSFFKLISICPTKTIDFRGEQNCANTRPYFLDACRLVKFREKQYETTCNATRENCRSNRFEYVVNEKGYIALSRSYSFSLINTNCYSSPCSPLHPRATPLPALFASPQFSS